MTYVIISVLMAGMLYFFTRLYLLKKSMKNATEQLREVNEKLEENRMIRLLVPNREMEELLSEINHSLQEIRQERVRFIRQDREFKQQIENISHDLRTPLTSMLGYLKIMDTSNLNVEEREDLGTVIRKAERLQELIHQFYDFSRLTAQDYPLDLESIDVIKILREVIADSYTELSAKQLDVMVQLPETEVTILGNKDALKRVFQNLLQNAGRYAVSTLVVSVVEMEKQVSICFKNDTKNITEQEVEKIFERFYTVDKARSNGSTGLGLTIAKEFMEKMGGSIEAGVEDGKFLAIRIWCMK